MSRKMPVQKPGRSETIVRTPMAFVKSVARLLRISQFSVDLAALSNNKVCIAFIHPKVDSLKVNWRDWIQAEEWGWLNPPYDNIAPWVAKACVSRRHVAVLVPASVGSNWWRDYVHNKAWVLFLNGRITFNDRNGKPICSPKTGKPTPYPKDLALLVYGMEPGYDVWDWKKE